MRTVANLTVGKAQISPSSSAHIHGVREGNALGNISRDTGIRPFGHAARGTAERSTGINANARNPIDPHSPNLSPA